MLMSIPHNALFQNSLTHSVNDSLYDFDWVFLEIPVKNCIVGMLLTCPIANKTPSTWFEDSGIAYASSWR